MGFYIVQGLSRPSYEHAIHVAGCDSILAAPLVIDLFRFMELAKRRGMKGLVDKLAIYFKDPLGTDILDLCSQYALFSEWITQM